jgi:catechol 2,3-dioxygenase-like lactoylglutathione lyase family enzyme
MSKRFHIAIATDDLEASVRDYTKRLGATPEVLVKGRYALWRTDILNLSISYGSGASPGTVRHIGFEDDSLSAFTREEDVNGITWEYFSEKEQKKEIRKKFNS